MSGNPKAPEFGEINIDASVCAPYIVDLPPGGLHGLRPDHDGVDVVVAEVTANQASYGDRAGVTAGDFAQLGTAHARVQEVDVYLPAARKMVELLEETRAQQVDLRERAISSIAHSVDARARQPGNKDLLAKYEATRAYRSDSANKAVKTRKKNAEEKSKAAGSSAPDTAPTNGSTAPAGSTTPGKTTPGTPV